MGAGSTALGSPEPWGAQLRRSFAALQSGFLFESLRSRSVLFRLLGDAALARVPMAQSVAFLTANASAWVVGAGKPVPLSKLSLSASVLEPVKACALIVVSEELLKSHQQRRRSIVRPRAARRRGGCC